MLAFKKVSVISMWSRLIAFILRYLCRNTAILPYEKRLAETTRWQYKHTEAASKIQKLIIPSGKLICLVTAALISKGKKKKHNLQRRVRHQHKLLRMHKATKYKNRDI